MIMNEANALSKANDLNYYISLSNQVQGVGVIELIKDVLSAPGIYVFTELYESPRLVEASKLPEVAPYYSLLSIFLHGTFKDYKENISQLPEINQAQLKKLKLLSIVTLSETQQTLPYDLLRSYLDLATVRELEDIIMDGLYQGVLSGKLDQRQRQLQIFHSIGRDVRIDQFDDTIHKLEQWSSSTNRLLGALDAKIANLQETIQANEIANEAYLNQVEQLRRDIRDNTNLKKVDISPVDVDSMIKKKNYTGEYASPDYSNERVKKR